MFSFQDICAYFTGFLLFAYRRILLVTFVKNVAVPVQVAINSPRGSEPLPVEALDLIFSYYIAFLVNEFNYGTVRDYRTQQKLILRELCKVAVCSRTFNLVMRESLRRIWARCPSSLVPSPDMGIPVLGVWIITAETEFFPLNFNLAAYKALEVASVNYHRGVEWSLSTRGFVRSVCISAYPRSLRQLEILRLHTPAGEVIKLVSDCCPGLTELRLVMCTMFNDPKCWYWRTHTANQHHDYMRSSEPAAVVAYANHLAFLLRRLRRLEAIHIGHYLISMDAVLKHRTDECHKRYHPITDRTFHIDGVMVRSLAHFMATANQDGGPPIDWKAIRLADRELWAQPCPQCEHEFGRSIKRAERLAATILAAHFDSLKNVSFAGFLSDRRIRPSPWQVRREQSGEDLYVWTEGANDPHSRRQQMILEGIQWRPLQMIH